MKASEIFEKRIHRIHELLEGQGAEVTWDDRIPDPDNPSQLRQIDISVRRDGKLTFIECRHQSSRQDVQWIEELIGRRESLKPDAIVAVSSSGFTAGALRKANQHGIVTHDFRKLSGLEVKSWGQRVDLTLYFYQYSDLEVSLFVDRSSFPTLNHDVLKSELESYPGMQSLFNAAARELDSLNLLSGEYAGRTIDFDLPLEGFQISGTPVLQVGFRARLIC